MTLKKYHSFSETFETSSVNPRPTTYLITEQEMLCVTDYVKMKSSPFLTGDIVNRFDFRLNFACEIVDRLEASGTIRRLDAHEKTAASYHKLSDAYLFVKKS